MLSLLLSATIAGAAVPGLDGPYRSPMDKPLATRSEPDRSDHLVHVKLVEGTVGVPTLEGGEVRPLFQRDPAQIRAERERIDPAHALADLTLWFEVEVASGEAAATADAFNDQPWVEIAVLAMEPVPPPVDIPPTTPDLSSSQSYAEPAPVGFGFGEAASWPGGRGNNVRIADLEYAWDPTHEDLGNTLAAETWGLSDSQWDQHGLGVLGMLFAEDNGYGITGMTPEAELAVIHPYTPGGNYNVAAAIDAAAALLEPGDVLLIEQQWSANGNYAPVEFLPAVFDAIANAVALGIVVVEPSGNGYQDLDDPVWEGWFDRDIRDSGAIMVGGGASPSSGYTPLGWYPSGSCYGTRIDVQGWYDGITSTWNTDWGYADLFDGGGDAKQGYTSQMGGTSGASPLVTGVVAIAQSVAIELRGEPLAPMELRARLVSTGTPQTGTKQIGPQPDLRRLLRAIGP